MVSHAILGATLAYINGGDPTAGGSAAVASEAAAYFVNGEFQANLLSETEKAQIRDLTAGIGAVIGGAVGDSSYNAQLAGVIGQNAVENNGFGVLTRTASVTLGSILKIIGKNPAKELKSISQKQLDKKFKHAEDFGIHTTKKNTQTLKQFEKAVKDHMNDPSTIQKGSYGFVEGSKVFFNTQTQRIVVLDKSGNFVTGFKLLPNTPQYANYMKNGVLR